MTRLALLVGLASTLGMVGLIWFVQVVHYPLFARVGASGFALYEAEHSALTTWVVAPFMLAELGSALYLAARPPQGVPAIWVWLGVVLCGVVWAATASLSVPQHSILAAGFDARAWRMLVLTNWVRTLAWSARGILMLAVVNRVMR